MPLPVIADVFRVAIQGTCANGAKWNNILHFRKTSILTFSGAIAIADPLIFGLFNSSLGGGGALKNLWHTTQTLDFFRYTPLDGISASTVIAHALAGLAATDPDPAGSSLVVTEYTALRGRAHRGRIYLPPGEESWNNSSGLPQTSTVAAVQLEFNGWLASFSGSGVTPVVASYLASGSAENITSYLVRSVWSSQRRRNH